VFQGIKPADEDVWSLATEDISDEISSSTSLSALVRFVSWPDPAFDWSLRHLVRTDELDRWRQEAKSKKCNGMRYDLMLKRLMKVSEALQRFCPLSVPYLIYLWKPIVFKQNVWHGKDCSVKLIKISEQHPFVYFCLFMAIGQLPSQHEAAIISMLHLL
jgi:hypothetical protein